MTASNIANALARLLELRKQANRPASLRWICRQTSIKSSGHLSDVLGGHKVLSERKLLEVGHLLELTQTQLDTLVALGDLARPKKDPGHKEAALRRLAEARKWLVGAQPEIPINSDIHLALRVLASFGLFEGRPTMKQLHSFFNELGDELEVILDVLIAKGLVLRVDGRFRATHTINLFGPNVDWNHLTFLKSEMRWTGKAVEEWFDRRGQAIFEANILTVKRRKYEATIRELRQTLRAHLVDLEDEDGDVLIHFNAQVFPESP